MLSPRGARAAGWLWIPVAIGALLRLLAVLASSPTPGDDAGRLAAACRWALSPHWIGLSGVWAPLHAYLLGGLIVAWDHPLFWARLVGWLSTTATLPVFFLAVREASGDVRRAGWATLLLALYYVHIWMAATAYVEGPYALALVASLALAFRSANRARGAGEGGRRAVPAAVAAGLAMALALLLRHEAKPVWALVMVWLALNAGRGPALAFAIPSALALAWQLVEPSLRGASFAHDVEMVAAMKAAEVALHGSRLEALKRWIVMPAGSPSLVVVALGLAGLWLSRRTWRTDLFGWLFVAQVALYLGLTVYPGWQPYLRYLFLYFLCLLPHAGRAIVALGERRRALPVVLVALLLLNQGAAWWKGRNDGRPLGWLPIYRAAPAQSVLDGWVRAHGGEGRVLALEGYPQAWDVTISLLTANRCDRLSAFESVSYDDQLRLARGERFDPAGYDLLLLDPTSPLAPALRRSLAPNLPLERLDPRLQVVTLSPRGGAAPRPRPRASPR